MKDTDKPTLWTELLKAIETAGGPYQSRETLTPTDYTMSVFQMLRKYGIDLPSPVESEPKEVELTDAEIEKEVHLRTFDTEEEENEWVHGAKYARKKLTGK